VVTERASAPHAGAVDVETEFARGQPLSIKSFMKLCRAENDRRMASYDARLVKAAMPFLGLAG
jgi:hypothetical protein